MLIGLPPFYYKDRKRLDEEIKYGTFALEGCPISEECQDLILDLLQKNPSRRLGSKGGASEIKSHPWFEGVDWKIIEERGF